jgi:hypothetical protein
LAKEERPFLQALDQSFQEQTGQTFQQYVTEFEREQYFYFFPQVHHPAPDEFAIDLTPPKAVTIDHAGIRADRREGQGIYSATGRVFVSYKIANRVARSPVTATVWASTRLKTLQGITNVENIPVKRVSLVLLPSGEALVGNTLIPALRYAYRIPVYVTLEGARKSLYVWFDAEDDRVLEVVPLFSSAGHLDPAIGTVLLVDPSSQPATMATRFQIDHPDSASPCSPQAPVTLTVSAELKGLEPDGNGGTSPFCINQTAPPPNSPWDFSRDITLPGTGTLKEWEKIDVYATVSRYRETVINASLTLPPNDPITIELFLLPTCEQTALARFTDMSLIFDSYESTCPQLASTSDNSKVRPHNDHTLIAHEMGHLLTKRQYKYAPPNESPRSKDWCFGASLDSLPAICPLPVDPQYAHDFADAWVQIFEDTNCIGGYIGSMISWQVNRQPQSYGNDSIQCNKHHEGGGWPRLSKVPDPTQFDPPLYSTWPNAWDANGEFSQRIGDHFPEHRKLTYSSPDNRVPDYADMQIAAAALWETREGAMSLSQSGNLDYVRRFVQALATTGWLGLEPLGHSSELRYTDKDVYRGLVDLEIKLANQWTRSTSSNPASIDRSVNKVAAGFARAGIFMIHPNCLDSDGNNNAPCIDGDSGGDAVIDIADNDALDDRRNAYGVVHEERDWLRPGKPFPAFHVWTGPRYIFDTHDVLAGPVPAPLCNNMFQIYLAEDEAFTQVLKTSGWREISPPQACYSHWILNGSEWQDITDKLAADQKDRIYYRVTTCTVATGSGTSCTLPGHTGAGRPGGREIPHGSPLILDDRPIDLGNLDLGSFDPAIPGPGIPNPNASHIRHSTRPANGLFNNVQPPYAIVNQRGTYPSPFDRARELVATIFEILTRLNLPRPPEPLSSRSPSRVR